MTVRSGTARPGQPLRLLSVATSLPAPTFIERRVEALVASGASVTVAVVGGDPQRVGFEGADALRLPHASQGRARRLARLALSLVAGFLRHPRRLFRLVASLPLAPGRAALRLLAAAPFLRVDVDLIHFEWNSSAIDYDWLPGLLGCPFVVSCRGRQVNIVPHLAGQERFVRGLRRSFARAALVHCVSDQLARAAASFGLESGRARVIYTGVDTSLFRPRPGRRPDDGRLNLVTAGMAMWRKGYEYLLLALREVVTAGVDVRLDVFDEDGPERDRVLFTADDLGLSQRVRIHGLSPPETVRDAYWGADLFVLASLSEGISNAVVEAMATGLPVVTTDCGGMSEAVTNDVEGLLVPTRDPAALGEAILRLAKDPGLRGRMGRAGRARAVAQFDREKQAARFLGFYREAIGRAGTDRDLAPGEVEQRDPQRPSAEAWPGCGRRLLSAGRLDWPSGYEYAIRAIRFLADQGLAISWHLVGEGPYSEALAFAAREQGVADRVRIEVAPPLPNHLPAALLPTLADQGLFLHPVVKDGNTPELGAALAAGLAVVAADTPELRHLLADHPKAMLVPRRDPTALAGAIRSLLSARPAPLDPA